MLISWDVDVHEWLMIHHTIASNSDCGAHKYHVFATAEYPIFGSKSEYINANIGIPLGPLSVEVGYQCASLALVARDLSLTLHTYSSPARLTSASVPRASPSSP